MKYKNQNKFCYDIMELEPKKQELQYYFDFSKEEGVEEGVKHVANIGTYIREQMKHHRMQETESRGIAIGENRGILLSAKKLYD